MSCGHGSKIPLSSSLIHKHKREYEWLETRLSPPATVLFAFLDSEREQNAETNKNKMYPDGMYSMTEVAGDEVHRQE